VYGSHNIMPFCSNLTYPFPQSSSKRQGPVSSHCDNLNTVASKINSPLVIW